MADREDARGELHRLLHARGHATEGERCHHEGVPWRRQVGGTGLVLSIASSNQTGNSVHVCVGAYLRTSSHYVHIFLSTDTSFLIVHDLTCSQYSDFARGSESIDNGDVRPTCCN